MVLNGIVLVIGWWGVYILKSPHNRCINSHHRVAFSAHIHSESLSTDNNNNLILKWRQQFSTILFFSSVQLRCMSFSPFFARPPWHDQNDLLNLQAATVKTTTVKRKLLFLFKRITLLGKPEDKKSLQAATASSLHLAWGIKESG